MPVCVCVCFFLRNTRKFLTELTDSYIIPYEYHATEGYQHTVLTLWHDPCSGRTAPLTSKRCILYIYSTNTGTEYFKHRIYSPFFSLSSKCSLFHNFNIFGSQI